MQAPRTVVRRGRAHLAPLDTTGGVAGGKPSCAIGQRLEERQQDQGRRFFTLAAASAFGLS